MYLFPFEIGTTPIYVNIIDSEFILIEHTIAKCRINLTFVIAQLKDIDESNWTVDVGLVDVGQSAAENVKEKKSSVGGAYQTLITTTDALYCCACIAKIYALTCHYIECFIEHDQSNTVAAKNHSFDTAIQHHQWLIVYY